MVGFVVAATGLSMGQAWWRPLAVASAAVSLVAIVLFWEGLPIGSRVGAVSFNAAVLVGLLIANWPAAPTVGS